ncbi:pentapeptide repeat-containing protein [Streptomyces sp. NPDC058268]|uniref:pentapeptide repeat-containing protein n=1 Tax=Streptomyces sp. NPDC058268 TaxID=3346413 RepID=UPI0036E16525
MKVTAEGQFRLALVQIAAALGAALALTYTARMYWLARRGQVTDRFTKVLERLGSDETYIRVGAVHALEQILYDDPEHAESAAQVLAEFVRSRAPLPNYQDDEADVRLPGDVQAALHTMTRINIRSIRSVDLADLGLPAAKLSFSDLSGATLKRTDLAEAELQFARLTKANFSDARCERASFYRSDLEEAVLTGADLHRADFRRADLTRACMSDSFAHWGKFDQACLVAAGLQRIKAERAMFDGADLRGARLEEANLSGAWFREARVEGAEFHEAELDMADLSRTRGLTAAQVLAARPTSWTVLPHDIGRDPRVVARILDIESVRKDSRPLRSGFEVLVEIVGLQLPPALRP